MDYLGQSSVQPSLTITDDELKAVRVYTHVRTGYRKDKDFYRRYGLGTVVYHSYPFNWVDLSRNHLENKGSWKYIESGAGNWGIEWKGRAFVFPQNGTSRYLNTLSKLIQTPEDFIYYLKLAPLAGFNVTNDFGRGLASDQSRFSKAVGFQLPIKKYAYFRGPYPEIPFNTSQPGIEYSTRAIEVEPFNPELNMMKVYSWWMEVITWDVLQMSFTMLRMSQMEDLPDLYGSYKNAEKYINKLRSDMRSPEIVDILPVGDQWGHPQGIRVELSLTPKQIEWLEQGIRQLYTVYHENHKKMAERIIQLQDIDAKILPTAFSVDPHQNPHLVLDPERSAAEERPIFTNIARNAAGEAGMWNPPEVAGRPEDLKYWEQVPDFVERHERKLITPYGPMSEKDSEQYGLDDKGFNWLPWLIAGGAATYAATQLM